MIWQFVIVKFLRHAMATRTGTSKLVELTVPDGKLRTHDDSFNPRNWYQKHKQYLTENIAQNRARDPYYLHCTCV